MAKFLRFPPIRPLLMIGSVRHVCTQPSEEREREEAIHFHEVVELPPRGKGGGMKVNSSVQVLFS